MMRERFDFFTFYSQLIVSDEPAAHVVLPDWTEEDVEQGYSRKPGSVSFGTISDVDDLKVEARIADELEVLPEAERAVVVPFTVSSGRVVLSDRIDDETIGVRPGEYADALRDREP